MMLYSVPDPQAIPCPMRSNRNYEADASKSPEIVSTSTQPFEESANAQVLPSALGYNRGT